MRCHYPSNPNQPNPDPNHNPNPNPNPNLHPNPKQVPYWLPPPIEPTMLLPQQPAIMDNGLEGTEHVLVLSVDASANEYIVRTKSGAEVRVPGGRLSAAPVPPTAAEAAAAAAAALEPGMDNLTRWLMSITMTPIPKASIGAKGAISSNANPHLPWPFR